MLTQTQMERLTFFQALFLVGLLIHKMSLSTESESSNTSQTTPSLSEKSQPAPLNKQNSPSGGGVFEMMEVKTDLYHPLIELGEENLPSEELFENMLAEGSLFGEAGDLWEQAVIVLYQKHNIPYPGLPGEESITTLEEWLKISLHMISKVNSDGLPSVKDVESANSEQKKQFVSLIQKKAESLQVNISVPPTIEHDTLQEPMLVQAYLMGLERKLKIEAKIQQKEDVLTCLPKAEEQRLAIDSGNLSSADSTNVLKKLQECHTLLNIKYTPPNSP